MRDIDYGKRIAEEMVLEQILEPFAEITRRELSDNWDGDFQRVEGSPDFVVGLDSKALGIELAEIRGAEDARNYYEAASQIGWKKHTSYERRGLFANPIALLLYSFNPPLFDMKHEMMTLVALDEFGETGFTEVWSVDLSDVYYTVGHPFRRPDMFCFKPRGNFGFHRIGNHGRKPYG